MKVENYLRAIFVVVVGFVFAASAMAQDTRSADAPQPETQRPAMKQMRDRRADFLQRLGLTQEQVQQIRKIHQEKKILMNDAQKRFRLASQALNEAIYADQINEAEVQARLAELQLAQAELDKLRYTNELAVRRVLTQDQLMRFRELRQRFDQMREALKTRQPFNGVRPADRHHRTKPDGTEPPTPKDKQRQEL